MKNSYILVFVSAILLSPFCVNGQNPTSQPQTVSTGTYYGQTAPLSELPTITEEEFRLMMLEEYVPNEEEKKEREYPFAATALPQGPDPVWQKEMGKEKGAEESILLSFQGTDCSVGVSDCNGAIGPDHYMLTINSSYTIYDKEGNIEAGPTNMNLLFGSVPGANCNDGDPIILYDEVEERWLAGEFSLCGSTDRMLIAVSTTSNPTGTWHQYSFDVADMPDYEKFGIWRDAYYMGTNTTGGTDIYAFEKDSMLVGGEAQMVAFDNAWKPNVGGVTVPPLDNDGVQAPEGSPGMFIAVNDDSWGGSDVDQIWIYEFVVDWEEPSNSTFEVAQEIDVSPFDSDFGPNWDNIIQPGTSQKLDGLIGYVMNRPQYRNFGTYETIVLCHTVDVDQTDHAGIRWYELRRVEGEDWEIRQEGTYAPDEHSRWMASIALNGQNEIGIGYSISSDTEYPGLRITGQSAEEYENASGIFNYAEDTVILGTESQVGSNRWGDYFNTSIDPNDDQTFWFAGEYKDGWGKKTRVVSFQFPLLEITASFSSNATVVCNAADVNFSDMSYGYPVSWSWSFPGGTPDSFEGQNPPAIVYNTNGFYDVSLTVSDGVDDNTLTIENYIEVKDVIADFSTENTTVVVGSSVSFTNNSECNPDSWEWVFEGGLPANFSGEIPPPIAYEELGVYDVSLIVTNAAGSDTMTKTAYIEVVECSLCPSEYSDTYYDWISNVNLNTIDNSSGSVGYEDYTDISTNLTAGSTYPMSITIDVNGSWVQHGKVWFDWNQDCVLDDDAEGYYFGLVNNTGTLSMDIEVPSDAVEGATLMRVSELWDASPIPCGGGVYGETEDYTVIISNEGFAPQACLAAYPQSGIAPLEVGFVDCSEYDPDEWLWDFGDASISDEQNPLYVYEEPGIYTVSLIVSNEWGSDTIVQEDYIEILLTGIKINSPEKKVLIYPNPTGDMLYLDFSSLGESTISFKVYDMSGAIVFSMDKEERQLKLYSLDVSELPEGNYLLDVISSTGSEIHKFTVSR